MRIVSKPKQRIYTKELDEAIESYGHGVPFMIIGLRMGLLALKTLDARGWFGVRFRAFLRRTLSDSCIIDGI